ncbi:MAG: ABC transporter permease [Pirellulaceae bacterium]
MHKVWAVAVREFLALVGTRTFLITLLLVPIMMFGGAVLMPLLTVLTGGKTRVIRVVDGTGQAASALQEAAAKQQQMVRELSRGDATADSLAPKPGEGSGLDAMDRYEIQVDGRTELDDATRREWSEEIRKQQLYAFVEIPKGLLDEADALPAVHWFSQENALGDGKRWVRTTLSDWMRRERLTRLGIDPQKVAQASQSVEVESMELYGEKGSAGTASSAAADGAKKSTAAELKSFLQPVVLTLMMFMVIFLAAQPMLESAMEEKTLRISEVLLGSVTPTQLLLGKLLGNVAASLLVFAFYATGIAVLLTVMGKTDLLPMRVLPWFIVFQVLGVLFYSSIFVAIGASVKELKEAQAMLMPVWIVLLIPMMVWIVVLRDPAGALGVGLSLFPPSAPMINVLRLGSDVQIPIWQPLLGIVFLLLSTLVVIWMAGRIYRASLLRSDSVKSLAQLFLRIWQPSH